MKFVSTCLIVSSVLIGCAANEMSGPVGIADTVFLGRYILTMDSAVDGASAVAIERDRIVAVGDWKEISKRIGKSTRVIELEEKALVPGFIDAHGHLDFTMELVDYVNLSSPPVGSARRIDDIVSLLAQSIEDRDVAPGSWILGYGYDDSLLEEARHPNRDDLDRVSMRHPILLLHVSGHFSTANSAALAALGLDAQSEDPPGGVIRRRPGSREPNGILEEAAAHVPLSRISRDESPERFSRKLAAALDEYARYGITTVQDGATSSTFLDDLRAAAARQPLAVDVAAFPYANEMPLEAPVSEVGFGRDYIAGVRVAGVKFLLDGSPQGRTAWMREPYTEGPPGASPEYVAYPTIDPDHYRSKVAQFISAGVPVLAHANGDAAIDLMIDGVARAIGASRPDHRSVTIHAQLATDDQLDRMKELGIVPSFFAAHPFFWGDWHRRSFGDVRASGISPLRGAQSRGLPFTIHNDAPVVPPDILRLIEIAVERRTRSGHILGPEERINVEEALHAVTLGAAYAYFEEDEKGSISPGKRADLVILSRDPRVVPSSEIAEIEVFETFARGKSVWRRQP